jgi:DNA repair exonuclease SbcCD ATPase subunit
MPEEKPFDFDEIMLIGDGVRKAIAEFTKLEKAVDKSVSNISTSLGKFVKDMESIKSEISENIEETKKLSKFTDQQNTKLNQASTDVSKLSKEYNDNSKAQKEAKIAVDTLSNSLKDQKEKVKILQKEYEELDPAIDGNEQKMRQLSKQIVRTRVDIKKMSDATKRMNATFDDSEGSYNRLIASNKRIKEILRKLPPEFIETNKRAQQLKKTFNENSDALKKFDKSLGENFRNIGNYGTALDKMNGLAVGSIKALGALGLAGAFAAGAKAIFDQTKQLEKNKVVLAKLTGAGGKDLDAYAAKATAVAKVFDAEFTEVARATNVLMESFGESGSNSLDIIEQALIRGADVQDDFLEQIIEYSLFFKEAGLNAQNMVDVLIAGEDKGIFSDKALDTVKEASIRIREMPQSTKDAIDALGISSDQLQRDLANGSKTVFEAIQEVSTEMGKLPEQSATVGTAIADIFGGAGEDAGLAFILTLKDITNETDKWKDSLTDTQKATMALIDSEENLNAELIALGTSFNTTGNVIKAAFNNILAGTLSLLADTIDAFTKTENVLDSFKKELAKTGDIAILTAELVKLKKEVNDPSAFDRFKTGFIAAFGGVSTVAKGAIEDILKIKALQDRIAEVNEEAAKAEIKLSKEVAAAKGKDAQDVARRQRQAARDLAQFQLEQQIRLLEETKTNEENSISERIAAANLIVQKQIEIAELGKEGQLDVAKKFFKEEKDLIDAQLEDTVMQAEKAGEDFANALFDSAKIAAAEGDFAQILGQRKAIQLDVIETAKNEELKLIEESNMSFREKEQERFDVEEEFRRKSLERELFFLKKQLALANISTVERVSIAKEISAVELELSRDTNEQKTIDVRAFVDAAISIQEALFESSQLQLEREIEALDMKMERNEAALDRELELAGDNEAAKALIKQQFFEEEKKLEKEKKKLLREAAQAQKKASIFAAVINIAQGVTAALASSPPPFNIILAAITGAAGAIQIGTILSTPLPAFAEGVKSAPGGKSIVGERGTELWVDKKKGEAGLTPSVATVVDLPKGVEVFDAQTTKRMLQNPEQLESSISASESSKTASKENAMLSHYKKKYLESRVAQPPQQQQIDYDRLGKAVARNLPPTQIWEIGNDNRVKFKTRDSSGNTTELKHKETDFIHKKNPIVQRLSEIEKELKIK